MPSENPTPLHFILTQNTEPPATCSSHRKNNLYQWHYLGNKIYIHIWEGLQPQCLCLVIWNIFCHNSLFVLIVNICIVFCFLCKFPVETTVIVRCLKIAAHSSTDIFLLAFRSNPAQAILSQPSPNSCTPLEVQAFCQHFPSIQLPAYSQIYLKKLISLPFPILGNAKATLYPKSNSMLWKQKLLLKWGWLSRRNTYQESGSSCRISACSCTSTTVFQ